MVRYIHEGEQQRAPEHGFTEIRANGGDRYWSRRLPGEPPPDAEIYMFGTAVYCAEGAWG
jgi:hypothetical protein